MVMTANRKGYTLVELLMTIAIIGILAFVGPPLILNTVRHFILIRTKIQLQQEARAAMYLLTRNLRQAQSTSIQLDQYSTAQPLYSRIRFTKIQGTTVSYYQEGNTLVEIIGNSKTILTKNLRYLAFTFPRSDNMTLVSVSLTLEQGIYQGQTKALHMASEKIQVMN